ncbi:MAG: 16S rRNA (adenine(1518)-N(6)/adenine(1519)-N(6))-dimethyltransferase RsmA [Rikenellaceae bacterium]|nr:16S rRNA (adenine(1518)-N(6)/adenine(1519)-N(6))-dimethyltransferase RsmA [Rikenellaceae bacterium]
MQDNNSVRAKKHLGQHFLTDFNIARKIATSVGGGTPDNPAAVLEVGSGTGVLTQYLLDREDIVTYGAEVDAESIVYLQSTFPDFARERLSHEDFLKMNIREKFAGYDSLTICGNFPYNISSQIFFKVLDNRDFIPEVVGMVQKEVAERIAEPPGSKLYGILSVLLQAWYDIEYLFTVNESVFNPPPKVKSAVIRLKRNEKGELGCNEALFLKVVKASFGQRRKMLRNALRSAFGNFNGQEHRLFNERAERLSVEDFVELTGWVESNL